MNIKAILTAAALVSAMPASAQSTTCYSLGMYVQCDTAPSYQPRFQQPIDFFGMAQRNQAAVELQQQQAALIEAQRRQLQRECRAAGNMYCPL